MNNKLSAKRGQGLALGKLLFLGSGFIYQDALAPLIEFSDGVDVVSSGAGRRFVARNAPHGMITVGPDGFVKSLDFVPDRVDSNVGGVNVCTLSADPLIADKMDIVRESILGADTIINSAGVSNITEVTS